MRIAFMGTRDLAVPVLQALIGARNRGWQVVGVCTQPDRPAGRASAPQAPPVKMLALAAEIPVWQPETLRGDVAVRILRDWRPDVGVVASFAQLLPGRVLAVPPAGWLNVHPSLLPRHRGPSPVASAILAGDAEAGVTLIKLVRAMDAGPIVDQIHAPIGPMDTAGELLARLGRLGAERLVAVLDDWVAGRLQARPQDESHATYSRLLTREDGRLDWSLPAADLARRVRAFQPWPGTFTTWQGRRLAILEALASPDQPGRPPGTVLAGQRGPAETVVRIATGDGVLAVRQLQLEGRRALDAATFLRGQPGIFGVRLG